MGKLNFQENFSLVTAILPKESAMEIFDKAIPTFIHTDILINARGVYYKDKWYQKFTPSISPEQTVLEMLVPDRYASSLMDNIAACANLHNSGTGAVYSVKCGKVLFLNPPDFSNSVESISFDPIHYKKNLTAIFCIIQKNMAEGVAFAAMRAGSPGPTITYGRGHGVRDKLGLLRIAISPEKELIRVVVDHYDAEVVFEAMVSQGKLDTPGMGFIYMMDVDSGLINISSLVYAKNELANLRQIIKSIDELKGSSAWRTQGDNNPKKQRKLLHDLTCLTCVVERGKSDSLVKTALDNGAPGASITFGMERGGGKQQLGSTVSVNREMEIIEMNVSNDMVDNLIEAMMETAASEDNKEIYFYTCHVNKALTYIGY
jgi:nitrogen regulatory protein P-II 1